MNYWLFKSEPEAWSWTQQVAKGKQGEPWTGVRNYQANNYMKQMQIGDLGFFYHSVKEKAIVGIVEIIAPHAPDPTDETGRFGMVVVQAVRPLAKLITLDRIKAEPCLHHLPLIKQSRLSVMPIDQDAWGVICTLSSLA